MNLPTMPAQLRTQAGRLLPAGTAEARRPASPPGSASTATATPASSEGELGLALAPASREPAYGTWLATHRPSGEDLARQVQRSTGGAVRVAVQLVVLPGAGDLAITMRSLRLQSDSHWSAIVLGDRDGQGSDDARVTRRAVDGGLEQALAASRPKASRGPSWPSSSRATSLEPRLRLQLAAHAWDEPAADLIFWDDELLLDGLAVEPRFRPRWSPDTLLGANYLGRSFAIRRGALARRGRAATPSSATPCGGTCCCASMLDRTAFLRVPRLLEPRRRRPAVDGATTVGLVRDHLDPPRPAAEVTAEAGVPRVRWQLTVPPHVTVVIPTRHNRTMLVGLPAEPGHDRLPVVRRGRRRQRRAHRRPRGTGTQPTRRASTSTCCGGTSRSTTPRSTTRRRPPPAARCWSSSTTTPSRSTRGWLRELVGWAVAARRSAWSAPS